MRNIKNTFTMKRFIQLFFSIPYRDNISVQVRKYCECIFKVFRSDYPYFLKSKLFYAKHDNRGSKARLYLS